MEVSQISGPTFPADLLVECFDVDFATGRLFWKRRPRDHFLSARGWNIFNSRYAGKEAISTRNKHGCESSVTLCGEVFPLQRRRVIWAMKHGAWPERNLGHRNDDQFDDRVENLREQTQAQQSAFNRHSNKTGVQGVHYTRAGTYRASIRHLGRRHHIGIFGSLDEARIARNAAALALHGEFARVSGSTAGPAS